MASGSLLLYLFDQPVSIEVLLGIDGDAIRQLTVMKRNGCLQLMLEHRQVRIGNISHPIPDTLPQRVGRSPRNETAFSLAAGLRVELINLVETLLHVESPPSVEAVGLS